MLAEGFDKIPVRRSQAIDNLTTKWVPTENEYLPFFQNFHRLHDNM